jgi:amino acid adenylation domain-containing protein
MIQAAPDVDALLPLDQLISNVAAANPSGIATVGPDGRTTYGELEAIAGRLASELRRHLPGHSPQPVVAVSLDRSVMFIPAILACWKVGAAFLPLDATQPGERLRLILEDAGAVALITSESIPPVPWPEHRPRIVYEDVLDRRRGDLESEPAASSSAPSGVAYVMYTSGSTGRPKGVVIEHRNLSNYVSGVSRRLRVPSRSAWAVVSSFTADLAYTGVFPPLANGGTVHVLPRTLVLDGGALGRYILRNRIDGLKISPTHFAALLDASRPPIPRMRLVFGGERLPWSLVASIRSQLPSSCVVFNHYGPTETTIGVSVYRCDAGSDRVDGDVPIGTAIANTSLSIVNESGDEVPEGDVGELVISGASVGRGYATSAASDGVIPFNDRSSDEVVGTRRYRSGDLVRRLPDGNLLFVGRRDDQLKVRGYRVESAEVEAALVTYPGVVAAVVVNAIVGRRPALVGCVVWARDASRKEDLLRSAMRERLPEFMVPDRLISLDRMPLLPSGKVDRREIAAMAQERLNATVTGPDQNGHDEDGSSLETRIVDVFRRVLVNPQLGVDDDFFDTGGNSLRAIQAIGDIGKAIGRDVPLALLFMNPTVRDLAAALDLPPRSSS